MLSVAVIIAAVVVTLSLPSTATDTVSSRLIVHFPRKLHNQNGYDHREALFGKPAYSGRIAQNVYYAQQNLCDGDVDTSKGVPSRPIDPKTNKMEAWPSPFILIVDRGGCSFVKKVRNSQRAGAAAVLIADNTCLCNNTQCMKQTGSTTCEETEPSMADDGSGADVSIPSYLMFKHDADRIKAELIANRTVQIEMSWNLPKPDNVVEYDLWTSPTDLVSRDFLASFKTIAEALGSRAQFTPHMHIYDGVKAGCMGSSNACSNMCTNGGRYCSMNPQNAIGVSGADVIVESLRRLCIWSSYGATDGVGTEWWDYIATFTEQCASNPENFSNETCINEAYAASKISSVHVENCMIDSGGTRGDRPNALLDLELMEQINQGVVIIPTATVNTVSIRGALNGKNMLTAICSGFLDEAAPKVCRSCASCTYPMKCVTTGICSSAGNSNVEQKDSGISAAFAVVMVLAVAGFFTALGTWYRKRSREGMRAQVRGILSEYLPLEEGNDVPLNGKIMTMEH